MSNATWKDILQDRLPEDWAREIDTFENQMALRKQGKIEEKVFAETRLRRGVYGQRYDNGRRHDGTKTQELIYPMHPLTKGPETQWDAPGMQRIKIPYGGMTPDQLRLMADLAEEYSDSIAHITTRQDFQLHYIHIEDTPAIMRRLAAAGITTREACGNVVRNITACPLSGVCHTEAFDVTPYSKAMMKFMLGHQDTFDFGRKFKIAFSGCRDEACGLLAMHDLGLLAINKTIDGQTVRGFEMLVGGGLGAVPYQAKTLFDFVPVPELLPLTQSIARVFAQLGEKKMRNRARIKFLVAKLGIDEFRRLVEEQRKTLPFDPRWNDLVHGVESEVETPSAPPAPQATVALTANGKALEPASIDSFSAWVKTNVYRQRQAGYAVVTVTVPLGDLSPTQLRGLADLAHAYAGDNVRLTVEQNIVLRWISLADLEEVHTGLKTLGLGQSGAGTIVDIVACPATDTCKLGIASSRGLAGELRNRLLASSGKLDQAIRNLRIKISGCFNSCGQHHVADIGFYGNSRNIGGYTVPHFQVVLGGRWRNNGGSYGMAIGSIPSKRIPHLVQGLTEQYLTQRNGEESFQDYCARLGKKELKAFIDQFKNVPPHDQDASFYSDWGDPREFTIGDMGEGECAGEVVNVASFGFSEAESDVFEAHLAHEAGELLRADAFAYAAMIKAARTLVQSEWWDVPNEPDAVVGAFKERFADTGRFNDKYAGSQFANYLLARHSTPPTRLDSESVHRQIDEAQLFIDAAHACHMRVLAAKAPAAATPAATKA